MKDCRKNTAIRKIKELSMQHLLKIKELIAAKRGIVYMTDDDYNELEYPLSNMFDGLEFKTKIGYHRLKDCDICPYCYRLLCISCPYGRRHGKCNEADSTYQAIIKQGCFVNHPDIIDFFTVLFPQTIKIVEALECINYFAEKQPWKP